MYRKDLAGQKFGRLSVIRYANYEKNHQSMWECECECGNIAIVRGNYLTSGHTTSCGCIHKLGNHKTHGMSYNSRLYNVWRGMKQRCCDKNHPKYGHWGGRGIRVCDEWLNSFLNFYDWAMGNGYQNNLSLDRINNDGNYDPSNCRWATAKEQANNRRKRRIKEV